MDSVQPLNNVPIIDLASTCDDDVVNIVSNACAKFGFFQIINHGIDAELIDRYLEQCRSYFAMPLETKLQWKRNDSNARGFFNDELTQQKRDWKQCLDVGIPGSRDWSINDDNPQNDCLDGKNQLPQEDDLPGFRRTISTYFDALSILADRIAIIMAKGLGQDESSLIIKQLRENHSSYLRSNYYPICDEAGDSKPLGISPHRDAGFLTILLQDVDCHSLQVMKDNKWVTIHPAGKYSFTINTGDMAEIFSNGIYKAPLHRVLSNETNERYSTPFFYNPSYETRVKPLLSRDCDDKTRNDDPLFNDVLWGYFRAVRFSGDLTDLGVEIQVADFLKSNDDKNGHINMQEKFSNEFNFSTPFSVKQYALLLNREKNNANPIK